MVATAGRGATPIKRYPANAFRHTPAPLPTVGPWASVGVAYTGQTASYASSFGCPPSSLICLPKFPISFSKQTQRSTNLFKGMEPSHGTRTETRHNSSPSAPEWHHLGQQRPRNKVPTDQRVRHKRQGTYFTNTPNEDVARDWEWKHPKAPAVRKAVGRGSHRGYSGVPGGSASGVLAGDESEGTRRGRERGCSIGG